MKCKSSEEGGKVIDVLCHPKILLICDIERGEERACGGAEATKEKRTRVSYLLRLLHHTALALLFATFGRVIYGNKRPSPSVLMPCDDRMLQSQVKRQAQLVLGEPFEQSPIVSQSEL